MDRRCHWSLVRVSVSVKSENGYVWMSEPNHFIERKYTDKPVNLERAVHKTDTSDKS